MPDMASALVHRIVVLAVVVIATASVVSGAPFESGPQKKEAEKPDCDHSEDHSEVYDQRQNGTENYRIHLNGVVVLVAPAETVLQAAQLGNLDSDLEHLLMGSSGESSGLKPKPRPPSPVDKVVPDQTSESKSQQQSHQKDLKQNVRHELEGSSKQSQHSDQTLVN